MSLEPCPPHLPDELVIKIFDSLTEIDCCPCHEEQAHYTIFDIAYVCRRFHRLISPFIYREFHYLTSGDGEHFLRTLASNPDLAALVEYFEWNPDGFLHRLRDVNDRGLIADKFLEIGTSPAIRFAEGFRTLPYLADGSPDFDNVGYRDDMFVEAVLMLTPNIKKVEVWGKFQPTFQDHPWTASMKLGIPHSFAHLSTVELVVACTPLEDLTPLIFLPSLKSLCLHEVGRPDEEPWTPEMFHINTTTMRPGASNIEHLSFKRCMIESRVLAAFIRFPHTLKSFEYQRYSWGEEEDAPQDYSLLTSALSLHRNSLETLKFSDDWQEGEVVSTMDSLAEFEQLKIVHLPLSTMLPKSSVKASLRDLTAVIDLLPRVLEEFQSCVMPYLYGERQSSHWEDLVPMLEIVAEHANERFPRLRSINVGRSHFYKDAQPDWHILERICSMRGITLSLPRSQDIRIVQISRHNEPVDDDSGGSSVEEIEIAEYFQELRLENTWDVLPLAEENGGEEISTVAEDQLE